MVADRLGRTDTGAVATAFAAQRVYRIQTAVYLDRTEAADLVASSAGNARILVYDGKFPRIEIFCLGMIRLEEQMHVRGIYDAVSGYQVIRGERREGGGDRGLAGTALAGDDDYFRSD